MRQRPSGRKQAKSAGYMRGDGSPLGLGEMPVQAGAGPASPAAPPATPLAAASPGLPPRGGVRFRALVLIRWVAVAGQLFTSATVHWGLGFPLPLLPVGGAIALSALLNLAVSLTRPTRARI